MNFQPFIPILQEIIDDLLAQGYTAEELDRAATGENWTNNAPYKAECIPYAGIKFTFPQLVKVAYEVFGIDIEGEFSEIVRGLIGYGNEVRNKEGQEQLEQEHNETIERRKTA